MNDVAAPTRFLQSGQRFGRLTVIDPERKVKSGKQQVRGALMRCDCGVEKEVVLGSLWRGATLSCGCLNKENKSGSQPEKWKHRVAQGQVFGELVVIDPDRGRSADGKMRMVGVRCSCGNELTVPVTNLTRLNSSRCMDCAVRHRTVWNRDDPDWQRRQYLWVTYHITLERYNELLQVQGGHCALCPAVPDKHVKKLHVDHDHNCCPGKRSCGKCVRGVLCVNCNSTLGRVEQIGLPELAAYYGYRLEVT